MIYAFDVDGTLTDPRQPMDKAFKLWFTGFCLKHKVVLVSGSDFEKIKEQVGDVVEYCQAVYANSGNSQYSKYVLDCGDNFGENEWMATHNKFEYPQGLLKDLQHLVDASPYQYRFGNHIEERPGMINLSVVGRDANYEDRIDYFTWDYDSHERDLLCAYIHDKYDGQLEAVKGGQISIDIYPVGKDKAQILDKIDEPIHFFGDKIHMGGNDHTIAMRIIKEGGTVSSVNDWRDTWEIIKTIG